MIPIATGALITRQLVAREFLGPNAIHSQLIRWKRKPIWLGTAKSKIFRVPKRQVIPDEEVQELKRLNNEYRTYRESIRRYFMDLSVKNAVQFDDEVVQKIEDEDFERCFALNEQWNAETAKSREKREADQLEERKQKVLQNIFEKDKRDQILMQSIEAQVKKAKEEEPTFITAANIDEAIEKALGTVVNYNVAIDSEGNKYEGKYEPPPKEPRKERLQAEQ